MKARIRSIRAPEPAYIERDGEVRTWRPMVLELLVEVPKTEEEARAQFKEAQGWAYPTMDGKLRIPPPVLEVSPPFEWPTCRDCNDLIVLRDQGEDVWSYEQYVAECPSCKANCLASTPMEAIQEFALELGA